MKPWGRWFATWHIGYEGWQVSIERRGRWRTYEVEMFGAPVKDRNPLSPTAKLLEQAQDECRLRNGLRRWR